MINPKLQNLIADLGTAKTWFLKIETFDWVSPSGKATASVDVTELVAAICRRKVNITTGHTLIQSSDVKHIEATREPNLDYALSLPAARLTVPVIFVEIPDGTQLLVDGTHRFLALYYQGIEIVPFIIVRYPDWLCYATVQGDLTA